MKGQHASDTSPGQHDIACSKVFNLRKHRMFSLWEVPNSRQRDKHPTPRRHFGVWIWKRHDIFYFFFEMPGGFRLWISYKWCFFAVRLLSIATWARPCRGVSNQRSLGAKLGWWPGLEFSKCGHRPHGNRTSSSSSSKSELWEAVSCLKPRWINFVGPPSPGFTKEILT